MVDKALPKFAARIAEIEGTVFRQRQPLPSLRLAPAGATGNRATRGGGLGRTAGWRELGWV